MAQAGSDRPALLLVNPHSRRGADAADIAEAAMRAAGLSVRRREWPDGEIAQVVRDEAGHVGRVVLGGGDGTLNAALPALLDTRLPFGVLPLGTANDLARTLGIPEDLHAAAAVIAAGHEKRIDIGCVNGVPFFNVANIGLSVDLTRKLTGGSKRRWGKLAYALVALRTLASARPFHASIAHCGETRLVRTLQVTVGNGRFYGGGMVVEKDAQIDDEALDFYSLEPRQLWRLLLMLPSFRTGHHVLHDDVRSHRCQELTITTRRPRSVSVDGEIRTRTPARFTQLLKAVTVYAPMTGADRA